LPAWDIRGDFPVSEQLAADSLALAIYAELGEDMTSSIVIRLIGRFYAS